MSSIECRILPAIPRGYFELLEWCDSDTLYQPEGVEMKCPFCDMAIPEELWRQVWFYDPDGDGGSPFHPNTIRHIPGNETTFQNARIEVTLRWMFCPNSECLQVIIEVERVKPVGRPAKLESGETAILPFPVSEKWFAVPRRVTPKIDRLVPEKYARDYREAWAILDGSYRMAAVLSRKILADLLAEYSKLNDYKLENAVEKFINDTQHPRRLRENMDYLRVIANLGAHSKEDKVNGGIIEATQEEAEWVLKLVADLFDYFIIDPARDQEIRNKLNERLSQAGRKTMLPRNPTE